MIVTGGQNVHAAEVEEILLNTPASPTARCSDCLTISGASVSRAWSSGKATPPSRPGSSRSFAGNTSPGSRHRNNSLSRRMPCHAHRPARCRNSCWSTIQPLAGAALNVRLAWLTRQSRRVWVTPNWPLLKLAPSHILTAIRAQGIELAQELAGGHETGGLHSKKSASEGSSDTQKSRYER